MKVPGFAEDGDGGGTGCQQVLEDRIILRCFLPVWCASHQFSVGKLIIADFTEEFMSLGLEPAIHLQYNPLKLIKFQLILSSTEK